MANVREIQKQVTRPTSAVVMMLLWEAFTSLFPEVMPTTTEEGVGKIILAVGLTGVIDKIISNRQEIKDWVKRVFTKKQKRNEKFERGPDQNSQGSGNRNEGVQ